MKLTSYDLLEAIGNADEKTVNGTAPRAESGFRMPRLRFRRTAELLAVCASICICIGGLLMIHKLHADDFQASTPEEQAAYTVLKESLDACVRGDREKIYDSMLEKVLDTGESENTEELLDALVTITNYRISACTQDTDFLPYGEYFERSSMEMVYYHYLEKGETEKAEEWRTAENQYLDFYRNSDLVYVFDVQIEAPEISETAEETDEDGDAMPQIAVIRCRGEWYVCYEWEYMILPAFGDENRAKLDALREKYGPVEFPAE